MKIERVLVVYKKSLYQLYVQEHREKSVRAALRRGDRLTADLLASHQRQRAAIACVEQTLKELGIAYAAVWRGALRVPLNQRANGGLEKSRICGGGLCQSISWVSSAQNASGCWIERW